MILIVSPLAPEADALATLCSQRVWSAQACHTVADFLRLAPKLKPRVVITRHRLNDGSVDDVLGHLGKDGPTRILVLATADCPPREESRLVSLGADQVFRDPVRIEVLLETVARHHTRNETQPTIPAALTQCYCFAGAQVFPEEHRLERNGVSVRTTPKVIEMVQMLHRHAGQVVTYVALYDELFGRPFSGDTANCRVLLAKADAAFRELGVNLRDRITVIPKSGYLYAPDRNAS